jgi:hypothetical protein
VQRRNFANTSAPIGSVREAAEAAEGVSMARPLLEHRLEVNRCFASIAAVVLALR